MLKPFMRLATLVVPAFFTPVALASGADELGALVDKYCIACHNDTLKTAGLTLQGRDVQRLEPDGEIWEKVLRKLRVRSMPPAGMPRPDLPVYESVAGYLQSGLDDLAATHPEPGPPSLRRLNRTEYFNAIRDLLAVKINDDTLLPADDTMYGFDNVGSVLTLSPVLAEQYINAARFVRRQALGEPAMQPEFHSYDVPMYLMQEEWLGEAMPFGTRGGIAIEHHFPMDGEYTVQIRLQRNSRDYIRGLLNGAHGIDVRLDGVRVGTLSVGGEKRDRSAGIYSSGAQGSPAQEDYERHADESLEVRLIARAGTRRLTVAFPASHAAAESPAYSQQSIIDYAQYKAGVPGVRTVTIGGPYTPVATSDTPTRSLLMHCTPVAGNEEPCARATIERLASRAYRRPVTRDELEGLMDFYRQGREQGDFDTGLGLAMERILAGPKFLFVAERVPAGVRPGELYELPPLELATRLALFLWSSLPDEKLIETASSGRLNEPEVMQEQIRRMLADSRSRALIDNFAAQWLNLGRLNAAAPNGEVFPYFDDNLRHAMHRETELFFEHVLREDRPLLELLDADYTFANERLAQHYGIPGVYGAQFRKVSLQDGPRGGLLGNGSILTVTSYANRTAPTIRGKWILENILGAPPPPPPANVPGLRSTSDDGRVLNMRQQMEQHRANPVCASCHKVMDPLGFALENYDAIGTWRNTDAASDTPIDASGNLPDGTPFTGPTELREVLVANREYEFVTTVIEKMLTYALGRGITYKDLPASRAIMSRAAPDEYRFSALIRAIVESTPFRMRRVPHADH